MNEVEFQEAERLLYLIYDGGYGKGWAVEELLKLILEEREQ